MPLYEYKCEAGHVSTLVSSVKDYQKAIPCGHDGCGCVAERYITSAPMVRGDYAGYNCPITDKWIEGRRAHEENLRRHGCRVLEEGETEAFRRRKALADAELDASVEATAEEFVAKLPQAKKEQLAAELDAGVSAEVVRI